MILKIRYFFVHSKRMIQIASKKQTIETDSFFLNYPSCVKN